MQRIALSPLFLLGIFVACSSSTTSGASPSSTGGATSAQIDQCHGSCDKMKFFACNSAEEQAACYQDCGKANPDQIQLFNACAESSICDPACRTNIVPKPADNKPVQGTGATASTCTTACKKLVTCSFIKVGDENACETECGKSAYQYQIDCINGTECGKIEKACGGSTEGGGPPGEVDAGDITVTQCQQACDQLLFFNCFNATDQSACRSTCASTTATKRQTFIACTNAAGPECSSSQPCYTTFTQP